MKKKYVEKSSRKIPEKRLGKYAKEINAVFEKHMAIEELGEYSSEISAVLNDYNRKSTETTMMVKGLRKSNQETTNRKTHQENLANIAVRIAKGMNRKQNQNNNVGLNCDIIDIMARNHDIRHTFLGHSGEWWLSNIKEDYGIGYYCHNALGPRELIYTNQVYNEIIEMIKQSNPNIGEKRLKRIKNNLWLIMEGINSHNGERSESEYHADVTKSESDFEKENLYCHTKKGFDRTVIPATPEAALMRLCDKISYIPYDMVDGLREGFIIELNGEYINVLEKLGITSEDIQECKETNHYEKIARKLQTIFIQDVIENSTSDIIKMSSDISKLLHELRNINNRQIVNFVVLKEDNEIYPPAIRRFMDEFERIIEQENLLTELKNGGIPKERQEEIKSKYKETIYEKFIQYICNTNQADFNYTVKIIEEATRQSIYDEQEKARDIVRNHESFNMSADFPNRDQRIQAYIGYYKNKDLSNYTEEEKQEDVETILRNIGNEQKRNPLYFNMNKRIGLELGAKYLSTLNDIEFIELLKESGIIDEIKYKSLTRKYREINLYDEAYVHENWKKIAKEQEKAVEEK